METGKLSHLIQIVCYSNNGKFCSIVMGIINLNHTDYTRNYDTIRKICYTQTKKNLCIVSYISLILRNTIILDKKESHIGIHILEYYNSFFQRWPAFFIFSLPVFMGLRPCVDLLSKGKKEQADRSVN